MKTISRYIMTLALLLTAVSGAWADETYTVAGSNSDMFGTAWDASNIANDMTKNGDGTYSITYTNVYLDGEVQYKVVKDHSWNEAYPAGENRVIDIAEAGSYTVTIHFNPTTHEVYETMPGIEVTYNDAHTEASFDMPQYDVTATYTIKRDISVDVTATMGDGTDGVRYRVKKSEQVPGKYEPAEMDMMQVLALVAVNDGIEQKDLTLNQDYYCRIYKLDEQTLQPAGDGVLLADFDFAPGLYALKAFAMDDSNYAGETALSNTFQLYDYINITFPKGYSTHYYNESLVLDEIRNSLKFYAVTAVTSEKVTLTEIEGKAIPGGTPFIVYNETAEPITAVMGMLQADDVTSAEQFKGTAEDKIMGSQSNCYILRNGDSTPTFRLVEGAGTLPAHRCYIDLGAVAGTRSLGFDFGDGTTGIGAIGAENDANGEYYDLQGRKHQGTPQRKGVYVKDGRKVIVR